MIKLRLFAAVVLGCIVVALAAPTSLVSWSGSRARGAQQEPPAAKEAHPWVRTLRGGTIVEIVGVSSHPSGPGTWWSPDGLPLSGAPYDHAGGHVNGGEGQQVREFVVRMRELPAGGVDHAWAILPSGSSATGGALDKEDRPIPGLAVIVADSPKDRTTCTVRFGVTSGPWMDRATCGPGGDGAMGMNHLSVIFGIAHESQGRAALTVSHSDPDGAVRVVAIDRDGTSHTPIRNSSSGAGGIWQRNVEFDLPLEAIREYRFQTRPFEWAEFRDVALRPRAAVRSDRKDN